MGVSHEYILWENEYLASYADFPMYIYSCSNYQLVTVELCPLGTVGIVAYSGEDDRVVLGFPIVQKEYKKKKPIKLTK